MDFLWHNRTKLFVGGILLLLWGACWLFGPGPRGDYAFALKVMSWLYLAFLFVPVKRCPACNADLGFIYQGSGPPLVKKPPQYVKCGRCGLLLDKWDDFTPVE